MGKADSATKNYLKDNEVFADAFNYLIYDGEPVISAEQLHEMDPTMISVVGEEKAKPTWIQKLRDVYKYISAMTDGKNAYLILGIESQKDISYIMPIRNMIYDAMEYATQIEKIRNEREKQNAASGGSNGEFLSGIRKEDKLIPVITLVIYFGAKPWDGPLSVHDMLATADEQILSLVENYRIHLITPESLTEEDLRKFKSDLREVLGFIKYSGDRDQMDAWMKGNYRLDRISRRAAHVLSVCAGVKIESKSKEKEAVDVCKAWDDQFEYGKKEGIEEGIEEGKMLLVRKLMEKQKMSLENAMDFFDIPKEEQEKFAQKMQSA